MRFGFYRGTSIHPFETAKSYLEMDAPLRLMFLFCRVCETVHVPRRRCRRPLLRRAVHSAAAHERPAPHLPRQAKPPSNGLHAPPLLRRAHHPASPPRRSRPTYSPDKPVWVLMSNKTFSAAEHFAHTAKALKRVKIVGENTAGGGRMCDGFWIHPKLDLRISTAFVRCEVDGGVWERVGVQPDVKCPADDALDVALLEALERFVPGIETDPHLLQLERHTRWGDKTGRKTLAELR
ncbi:ClpP/crotonase-like domain-containing protein [Fimicolochytrium jonesii]|uniref:ClpP/crotonase-like domain-containing protein n=1 Tax=Fimicolochytrium jonesii TaxID=1396493 RepID=UPI0022FDBABE|nr:ClpP/crotonase-like domain-containing protein [Fimicolochytrium jonesii]KAI8819887.1 ClpP/crotonase-like domain-containing protein [Fimicolochytrium jonesii]